MDFLDLLGDPAYRHMLLNHVPIIGLFVSLIVLLAGIVIRQAALIFTGLVLIAITAGAGVPVSRFGDNAYPAIYDQLDGAARDWLDYHAHLAETWLPLLIGNAVLALVALVAGARRRSWLPALALVTALVTVGALTGAALVGKAGGRIKHPEFRLDDPPDIPSER